MTGTVKTHFVHEQKCRPMVCAKAPNEALKIRVPLGLFGRSALVPCPPPSFFSDPEPLPLQFCSSLAVTAP